MKRLGLKKNRWKDLDVLTLSLEKDKQEVTVFINSSIFFRSFIYSFQKDDNRYAYEGMLEKVWFFFDKKDYQEANNLLDRILNRSAMTSSTAFAKFVVSLFLKEDAYPYLKETITRKTTDENDDEYRIYLKIYEKINEDFDIPYLLEGLKPSKDRKAFNQKSFNSNYLEFVTAIEKENIDIAKEKLSICLMMKPSSFHLKILEQLLLILETQEEEKKKQKRKQEKQLEKDRCDKFINLIKEKKFKEAKEQVELMIAYRNIDNKNNYSYQLFLEVLEMVEIFEEKVTFEIPVVSYTYQKEGDYLYTFLEAISIGDFKKASEVGKKCRNKAISPSEPKLKVGIYLVILDYLLEGLASREKEQESVYQVVQNNIQRGHFIHALELYENNSFILKNYQSKLILDLFESGIAIEKKEISFHEIYHGESIVVEHKAEQISMEELPIEEVPSLSEESPEEEIMLPTSETVPEEELSEHQVEDLQEVKEEIKTEIFYPVEPLLKHIEPNQEYFVYYVKCLEYGQYEEARYWLSQYGTLLKMNQLSKRLDHYYYYIEVATMESVEEKGIITKKEELYQLAYSAMRNYEYDKALTYLGYYEKMDTCRNMKAPILKGYIYRKQGRYESAIKCFIEANSISPNPDAYYFLGDIYYKLHRFQDAIFCYLTYNEFYPKEKVNVYLNLSEAYRRLHNSKKSLKYLKIADEINMNQNRGLNLKNRILREEMINHKREKFRLEKDSSLEDKEVC